MNGEFVVSGDFGIAKSMEDNLEVAKTCVGTPCYLSPEMCQDIPYSSKADIWVCYLHLLTYHNNSSNLFKTMKLEYGTFTCNGYN